MCCLVSLLFLELCNGLPIGLDHTYGDGHTQFLTGLIAILLTICGVVCLAGCMCCQRKDGFKEFQNTVVVENVPSNLDHGHINPLASTTNNRNEFTIFNPLTNDAHIQPNVFSQQEILVHSEDDWTYENIDVRSWFGKGEVEFPRTRLKYIRELGKGWFGRVVEGTAQGFDSTDKDAWKPVVVRILEASASSRQRILFLHDASIYRCTPHPNILLLLGRSLDTVPLLLLQEYTNQGDVKCFLKKQTTSRESFLNSDLPLRWCYHLTSALKHLHSANIMHLDLATRNCRLTDTLDLKLGDYGCNTIDYPEDYYDGTENVPIRWCAPESVTCTATTIQTKNVTQCSNIWSLGVCFWEVYECGAQPYAELTDDEVVSRVLGPPHVRLAKPKTNVLFTDYMYRLMQLCWSNSELRPTINQVYPMIEDLVNVHKNSTEVTYDSLPDFDRRWDSFKPNVKFDTHLTQWNSGLDSFDNLDESWTPNLFNDIQDNDSNLSNATAAQPELRFKLGPLTSSTMRTSSESETEDENWKRKVERGLYTEKVRQKSRSVADLMVLTHIDCSESDSETPLPSINYKNVRYAVPKQNLENVSLTFGSEGNLLSVQNTFEEELKKLQEERRDSLLFVPDSQSQSALSSPSKLLEDLNNPSAIEPPNQIFNVYNVVTISPLRTLELNKIINYQDDIQDPLPDIVYNTNEISKREIPKLSEIIENNIELMDYIIAKYDPEDEYLQVEVIEEVANEKVPDVEINDVHADLVKGETSESDEYVTANTHTVTDTDEITDNTSASDQPMKVKSLLVIDTLLEEDSNENSCNESSPKKEALSESLDDETEDFFTPMSQQNSESADELTLSDRTYCCDKPVIVRNADEITETVPNYTFTNVVQNGNHDDGVLKCDKHDHKAQIETLQSVLNDNSFDTTIQKQAPTGNHTISTTQDFLNNEILVYEDSNTGECMSDEREMVLPGALTSMDMLTSTPCPNRLKVSTLRSADNDSTSTQATTDARKADLKYSLETWDNFLGKSFDEQHEFDDYSEEPMSLLFTEDKQNELNEVMPECSDTNTTGQKELASNATFVKENDKTVNDTTFGKTFIEKEANATFVKQVDVKTARMLPLAVDHIQSDIETTNTNLNDSFNPDDIVLNENETFVKDVDPSDIHLHMQDDVECYNNPGYWESENSGGWYLHPQDNNDDDLQGEIDTSQKDDSYIRFSMDDEVMAAIRNELMIKLPQAQKAACEQSEEADGEYETTDRNEVFLRYNCFNMPLSPIPEESFSEYLNSGQSTPHCTINTDLGGSDSDSDWSEAGLGPASLEEDTHSPRLMESPHKGTQNRHTPSQDSCCSNDTLFNLEELQCNEKQLQEIEERKRRLEENEQCIREIVNDAVDLALMLSDSSSSGPHVNTDNDCDMQQAAMTPSESENFDSMPSSIDVTVIKVDTREKAPQAFEQMPSPKVVIQEFIDNERNASLHRVSNTDEQPNSSEYLTANDTVCFALQNVAPLNSPEDRPWKHIEASLTKCPEVPPHADNSLNLYDYVEIRPEPVMFKMQGYAYEKQMNVKNTLSCIQTDDIYDCIESQQPDICSGKVLYANDSYEVPAYVNDAVEDDRVYESVAGDESEGVEYENVNGNNSFDDEDYCPLGDIRFSGPGDVQMMTTSFSESNDLGDEHDWDSGSDTRSSSSGEFIWKEGEHEASVKALQAAPQAEATKEIELMDDEDTSSCSDEDGDGIEFVPSAWDKFATPTKSALRSPEKSLDSNMKKNRGVSFKKQKYHCVYEYPREPESTVVNNYDLWKDSSYIDWDLDRNSDPFLPGTSDYHETASSSDLNLIHNQHISYDFTGSSTLDDDFYISSSAKPFDMLGSATSQFFPGKHCDWSDLTKNNDNVTPDSGVEDITPGSMSDSSDYVRPNRQILPLKTLAQLAANKNVNVGNNEIGGLRHTRNRLKLDLPPSPNAFTKSKSFSVESPEVPLMPRQIPTFTTFGKSRFVVQQVDTSTNVDSKSNVSFEALPYKPMSKLIKNDLNGHVDKSRIEVVRGEASLLDSADEDSGIESCTLERKNVSEVSE